MGRNIKRFHVERNSIDGDVDIIDSTITKAKLKANAIQWIVVVELVNGELSVAADALGDTDSAFDVLLDSELLACAKSVYLEVAHTWAETADGAIKLYDATAAVDVTGSSLSFTGGESSRRQRTSDFKANLTAGNEVRLRVTISVAGAAGEKAKVHSAKLIIVCGAS